MNKLIALMMLTALTAAACTPTTTDLPGENEENSTEYVDSEIDQEETEEEMEEEATETEVSEAVFVELANSNYDQLLGSEPFALFFHAEWCPTCKALEADIDELISTFPKGSTVIMANFDTETELRKEFGVNVQSTVVIIDEQGEKVEVLAAPSAKEVKESLEAVL